MLKAKKTLIASALSLGIVVAGGCSEKENAIAKVNGRNISDTEFNAFLQVKRIAAQDKDKKERVLGDYLQREALADFVAKSDALNQELVEAEVREFKKQLLISRYFEQLLKDKVNDQAIRNYYAANAEQFEVKQANASHILIRTNPAMSDTERQALLTKAQDIYGKLTAGESFEELAKEYSEDKVSAKKGGELGWLKEGSIDSLFSEKVFSMAEGSVAAPFATSFGFHIVRLNEAPKIIKVPFEKVKGDIRYQLRQQAKEAEMKRINDASKIETL